MSQLSWCTCKCTLVYAHEVLPSLNRFFTNAQQYYVTIPLPHLHQQRAKMWKSRDRINRYVLKTGTTFIAPTFRRFRKLAKSGSYLRHVRPSAQNNSVPTERMFVKFDSSIFRKSVEKIQVHSNRTITTGTLHDDQYTFMIISRSFLLPMRNV